MKVRGIGRKSAEYIASIVPRVTELILTQYRELGEIDIYGVAILADWFLGYEPAERVGIIVCDDERKFLDFRYLEPVIEDCELEPYKTGDIIANRLACKRYFLVWKSENPCITRENILVLRDYTSRLASFMTDAFEMDGLRPRSVLYQK